MKTLFVCLAILGGLSPAFAADQFAIDDSPRFMLYMRLSLGEARASAMPRFGLSFERQLRYSTTIDLQEMHFRPRIRLIDWQFNAPRTEALQLGGAAMLSSDGERSIWKNPWLWVGIGVAVIGISCATDNFPCDDDGYGGGSNSSNGGSGGGY